MPRAVLILGLVLLTACGTNQQKVEGETNLRVMRNPSGTPEEFSVVPFKPLQTPETLAQLPQPTPGGVNRADQTPFKDAVAALGGSPSRLDPQPGIGAGDQVLVSRASRFGVQPSIRGQLAEEDLAHRKRRSLFSWQLFPEDRYKRAYRDQTLDQYQSLEAARRAGTRTPAAPPNLE